MAIKDVPEVERVLALNADPHHLDHELLRRHVLCAWRMERMEAFSAVDQLLHDGFGDADLPRLRSEASFLLGGRRRREGVLPIHVSKRGDEVCLLAHVFFDLVIVILFLFFLF